MVKLYSLSMNVLLGHCDNFIFSYFLLYSAFLDNSGMDVCVCLCVKICEKLNLAVPTLVFANSSVVLLHFLLASSSA